MREDEMSGLLRRASEISDESEALLLADPELAIIARSAEEAGLPREAVLLALRERLAEKSNLFNSGEIVLAESTDGIFYPAIIKEIDGLTTKVRFFQGGEAHLQIQSLQPFSAMPGSRFQFFAPTLGTWTKGNLIRFQDDTRTATFECWGSEYTVPLDKVRLKPKVSKSEQLEISRQTVIALIIVATIVLMMLIFFVTRR